MLSTKLMMVLIAFYVVLTALTLYEKQYAKATYWVGAIILNLGVILMK